jgi:hypothetical protein
VYTREQSFSRRKGKILLHNRYWPEQQMKNFLCKEKELIGKRNEKKGFFVIWFFTTSLYQRSHEQSPQVI